MTLTTILLIAVALGTDAFSLCIGLGMGGVTPKQIAIMTGTVLLFHIGMPLLGVYAGEIFGSVVGHVASYAGALVLLYLGIKMIYGSLKKNVEEGPNVLLTNTVGVVFLAGSVSMDALSVGFTLGTQHVALGQAALIIGLIAGLMTLGGLLLGQKVGGWIGEKAVIIGGLILLVIGVRLFF